MPVDFIGKTVAEGPVRKKGDTLSGPESILEPEEFVQGVVLPRALPVVGDSMSPEIPNGSVIIVETLTVRLEAIAGNNIAVDVKKFGGVVIKKLVAKAGRWRLESINPSGPHKAYRNRKEAEALKVFGKVVAVLPPGGKWERME